MKFKVLKSDVFFLLPFVDNLCYKQYYCNLFLDFFGMMKFKNIKLDKVLYV